MMPRDPLRELDGPILRFASVGILAASALRFVADEWQHTLRSEAILPASAGIAVVLALIWMVSTARGR